ncbi:type II toxin-antitoxin system VapC family toxin [Marispirochaeta aestuarii]|uniref:type II toxin-antitoxin system tRNA(fMet)-specific endonuclease VapC n=1 Tax=Marispirochaeta aestuarii TaxID=1963862 RepID=UPI002ABDEC3F|nr:type II toxin-antitoxin system VapC family toxin [Marispirochaeta aestuarii]
MKFYLDTNICIYFLKGMYESVRTRLLEKHPDEIKICSIVKAEILYAAEKSIRKDKNLKKIEEFLLPFEIISFGDSESISYAGIRSDLEKRGEIIGPNDLLIASTVLANNGILVTHNVKEFSRVRNLRLEDWTG